MAAPALTPHERATAVAGRTMVYLETTYRGYLTYRQDGTRHREALVVHRACSGVVVNPDGYVLTTDDCVRPDPSDLLADALHTLAGQRRIDPDQVDEFVAATRPTAVFSGSKAGEPPSTTVYGQLGVADQGRTTAPAAPATVVSTQSAGEDALALVKLQRSSLPAVELAADPTPSRDAEPVVLSYRPRGGDATSAEYAVRAGSATVTGRDPARLRLAGDLRTEDRGGAVVDAWGRLLALLDVTPATAGGPAVAGVTAARVADFLAAAGVPNTVSEVDLAYRDALRDYFAGRFSAAVGKLDALLRDAPAHSWARTYRDRARERLAVDGDAVENAGTWSRYLLSAVAGVLVIAAIGECRRRAWRLLRAAQLRAVAAGSGPGGEGTVGDHAVADGDTAATTETGPPSG
ncbi:trypsin-like peptidase domain-containing protein [Micromonospora sp. HM5-17]|uniref:trypsin-like peptidase domain-containing protein n=1 Tax=Micromonospora sp. HM5-17 TaxID=2487710 RepID=UPI000F4645E6|nr:trypsin-like peptidase domain-containing protein [Micromonospora sp. HM5-17]ROT28232.1 hypothetical protein EF879_21760 [Micromonospora sp. HM5-17]